MLSGPTETLSNIDVESPDQTVINQLPPKRSPHLEDEHVLILLYAVSALVLLLFILLGAFVLTKIMRKLCCLTVSN